MKLKVFTVALFLGIILAGCSEDSTKVENSANETAANQSETPAVQELIADISSGKTEVEAASITSDQLIIKGTDGTETVHELPADQFFVSIAPYVSQTHE
nr:hypothetical protein [Bacillus sp. EB01]